jgi:hypothetical protein
MKKQKGTRCAQPLVGRFVACSQKNGLAVIRKIKQARFTLSFFQFFDQPEKKVIRLKDRVVISVHVPSIVCVRQRRGAFLPTALNASKEGGYLFHKENATP